MSARDRSGDESGRSGGVMSERAQALEARGWQAILYGDSPETWAALDYYRERGWPVDTNAFPERQRVERLIMAFKAGYRAAVAAPPVGVSPQPDTRRDCTCLGTCRGAEGLGPRWKCALEKSASLAPVEPTPEPPPDAQVCVWREREWDYESGCRGTQISRDERSSGPPDGWKHCPYCGKRLEVGTAPQGGEQ